MVPTCVCPVVTAFFSCLVVCMVTGDGDGLLANVTDCLLPSSGCFSVVPCVVEDGCFLVEGNFLKNLELHILTK